MDYRQLIQRRADLVNEAQRIVASAKAEGRGLTKAERERFDEITEAVAALKPEIDAEELEREARRNAAPGPSVVNGITGKPIAPAFNPAAGRGYAELFGAAVYDAGGFASATDVWRSLLNHDGSRFQATVFDRDQGAGYLIPPAYAQTIFDKALQQEIVRPRATIYPMTTNELTIAGFSHGDGSGGARFGVKHNVTAPGTQATPQAPKTRAVQLVSHKLMALVQVPNEIVADAANLDRQMTRILADGLAWTLDRLFLTGSGVGEPLGVLNAPATITVAKDSGQAAGTLVGANLAAMLARLEPEALMNPSTCWVGSPSVLYALLTSTMVDGAIEPVLKATGPGSFTVLGLPFLVSEHLPPLGTKGDILLADFSDYAVGITQDYSVQSSPHLFFDYDSTAYRSLVRADGQSLWDTPYTPSGNGGTTVSPFVVLETRS